MQWVTNVTYCAEGARRRRPTHEHSFSLDYKKEDARMNDELVARIYDHERCQTVKSRGRGETRLRGHPRHDSYLLNGLSNVAGCGD